MCLLSICECVNFNTEMCELSTHQRIEKVESKPTLSVEVYASVGYGYGPPFIRICVFYFAVS